VHWSSRRLELERELACDERVLAHTGVARPSYASCLLRVGALAAGAPLPPAAALSMASQLRTRVEFLLAARGHAGPRGSRTTVACAVLALAGAALAIGAVPAVNVAVRSTVHDNSSALTAADDPMRSDAADRLRTLLYGYEAFGFHGGVLVVHRGEVLVREGFGMADRAARRRWTPETAFNGGAVAKMLTAAAILKLEEQGRLSVDDRVAHHLGPFPEPKSAVTIHHLLTHTGGLARQWAPIDRTERDDFVEAMRSTPADYPAGRGHRYTDHGHALLAAIIETAGGMSYEQYVRTELLEPAGMNDTRFENEPPTDAPLAVEYAHPAGTDSRIGARPYSWGRRGAMGVITTLDDLLRWHLALQDGRIFSDTTRTRMFAPRVDVGRNTRLAYGWEVGQSSRGTRIRHRLSAWPGNSVELVYDEDEDLFIALVANEPTDWGRPKYIELFNAAFGYQHVVTPAAREFKQHLLDPLTGRYVMDGATIDIRPAGPGTLRIDAQGDNAAALFSAQPTTVIARATGNNVFAILQWSRHRLIELHFDTPDTLAINVSGVRHTATRID
jgi:CubicO group peptidase (beta-lactamase class C family)